MFQDHFETHQTGEESEKNRSGTCKIWHNYVKFSGKKVRLLYCGPCIAICIVPLGNILLHP